MRRLWIISMMGFLVSLTACAVDKAQTESTAPTVSYAYNDDDDYDEVEAKADEYCDDEYDKSAVLVDRDSDDGNYEATFACK